MAVPEGILSYTWVAATAVVAPAVFGLGVVRLLGLGPGAGAATSWGFAYVIGQWLLAHATALWLLLGQPVPGVVLPIAAVALGISCCRLARKHVPPPAPQAAATRSWFVVGATSLAIAALAIECLQANAQPIRFSDEAEIWAGKAKVLYGAATIPVGEGLTIVSHGDYPNLNPLVQVLAFAASGRVLHWENRLPLQCFAVALVLLLAGALRRRARSWLAAAAVVACGSSLMTGIVTAAYADVPLACAALAAVDALLRWRETGSRVWWRLACGSLAAMLATKNEGAMLAIAILVPVAAWSWFVREPDGTRRQPSPRDLAWLLAPVVTLGLHLAFNAVHGLHNDIVGSGIGGGILSRFVSQAPTHVPAVAAFFASMAIDANLHRLLPLLCVTAAIAAVIGGGRRWLREPAAMVTCMFVLAAFGYAMVFVATPADVTWHLLTAAARTLEHVVPIATLALCITIAPRPPGAAAVTSAAAG